MDYPAVRAAADSFGRDQSGVAWMAYWPRAAEMTRSLFAIRSESGHVKVGIAGKPRRRLSQLRTSSATALNLCFVAETDGDVVALERRVHEILRERRLAGEWFSVSVNGAIGATIQAAQELDLDLRNSPILDSRKKRGRPTTGIGSAIGLRLYPELDRALDTWIAQQPEPRPSRPEAIRLALRAWLTGLGLL